MSKYLKTPDYVLTTNDVFLSLSCYVLNEYQSALDFTRFPKFCYIPDNGEEDIQEILNNSKNQLRMYGSAKEIAEYLKIYRDFPFSIKFFKSEKVPFYSPAVIYESLKGEKFISNLDILIILQNMALEIFPETNPIETRMGIMAALRSYEIENVISLKFIKFDEKAFDEIEKEIREFSKSCHFSNIEQVQFENRYLNIVTVAKGLHDIIHKRPNLFSGKSVPFVRVFEDGSERFVMKAELFNAISNDDGSRFKEEDHLFTTISMNDVDRIYGHRVKNIEFIRTPITRTKHRSVIVKGHYPGEYGFLATEHLFDFFRDLFFGQKLFQRISNPNWKNISDSFEVWFEKYFKPECKTPYFIENNAHIPLKFDIDESLRPKDIRNAKIDGFTIQNLKNELVHLGLNRIFPEIGDHAETVYSAVDQIKKGQYLRTCDLFDAVFYCQLICLFDRVPKFKRFLHNQSGCGRVLGYNCEMCQKKKSEIQKSLELSSNESKGIESSENMKKEDTKMISFKEYEEMKMKILELEIENRELKEEQSRSSNQIDNIKMDKLSIDSSIPTVSTNNIISECLICELELKTTGDTLKCPMCKTRFHSKCAMEYVKHGVTCPSCKGTLQSFMVPSKLF